MGPPLPRIGGEAYPGRLTLERPGRRDRCFGRPVPKIQSPFELALQERHVHHELNGHRRHPHLPHLPELEAGLVRHHIGGGGEEDQAQGRGGERRQGVSHPLKGAGTHEHQAVADQMARFA